MTRDDAVRAATEALHASRIQVDAYIGVCRCPRDASAAVDAAAPHLTTDLVRERDEALAQSERDLADALIYKARWNEAMAEVERLREVCESLAKQHSFCDSTANARANKAEKELRRLRAAIDSGLKVGPGDPDDCPGNNGNACCGYPDICKANW